MEGNVSWVGTLEGYAPDPAGAFGFQRITNGKQGAREGFVQFTVIPQALAFVYYQLSWLLYVPRQSWSYRLNADFEDHPEHE